MGARPRRPASPDARLDRRPRDRGFAPDRPGDRGVGFVETFPASRAGIEVNDIGSKSPVKPPGGAETPDSARLLAWARTDGDAVLKELGSRASGLSEAEADSRWKKIGPNEIAREKRQSALMRLLANLKNPLVLLLVALGVLSYLTGDLRATVVIFVMVVLGVVLRFFQELRADNAAAKLQAMVSNTATLVRDGKQQELPLKRLVPGDIIRLAAGDMVPADVRVLSAKDLFLNQAALTGEALPVEKKAAPAPAELQNPLELPCLCFLGSNVESGSATAVADPLSTLDPRKQRQGSSSGFWSSAGAGAAFFSTGSASPVRAAWFKNRSFAESTRTSAGTMSPAASRMMSPGTSLLSGSSCCFPSRTRVAVLLTIAWSFAAALSARSSWKKRSTTPRTTITKITTVARRSPVR